ncbi:MAG TPA: MFS transporter [Anaerolineae bacterium]|nr:MFS transporter [Anaerolineae bacterium]
MTETQLEQTAPIQTAVTSQFSVWRTMRLGTFQIGSAMADILTASVWNRVMIADFGVPATPVGFLLALQYLLIPVAFWAGYRSDTKKLWGKRRISYIWLGRSWMVLSFPLLGLSVRFFEQGEAVTGWLLALATFLLFGLGKLLSGSVYLALVRESAPAAKQGIAIGMVEITLIASFPIMAVMYGRWMETYDPRTFATLLLATAVICGFFWWISIAGAEKHIPQTISGKLGAGQKNARAAFKHIWQDGRVRRFFVFLFVATFAAWMQDNILEPFGADVFGLEAGQTTRFTGYWGAATIIVLLASFIIWRKRPPETLAPIAKIGLVIMGLGMALLAGVTLTGQERWLTSALILFGLGFGLYSFGGLSLMVVMSPDQNAGAYLGLWSICILISKGLGTFAGGLFRDIFFLGAGWTAALSYAFVFVMAATGLLAAAAILSGRQVISFTADYGRSVKKSNPN